MRTTDEAVAEVKAVFPDAQVVEVRDIEPIPWCDAFDKHLAVVRAEGERFFFYCELRWIAMELGRKLGWAAFFYKDEHGEWPPWGWSEIGLPMEPTEKTRKKVRRRDRLAREAWKAMKQRERLEREQAREQAALVAGSDEAHGEAPDEAEQDG